MSSSRPNLPTNNNLPSNFTKSARLIMPDTKTMASNLLESAKKIIDVYQKTGQILVDDENAKKRLEICKLCFFYDGNNYRCSKCGCFMIPKTKLKSSSCPIQKW